MAISAFFLNPLFATSAAALTIGILGRTDTNELAARGQRPVGRTLSTWAICLSVPSALFTAAVMYLLWRR